MQINGYKVIVDWPRPRMQLSEKVAVTNEFRVEYNKWLLDFFGWAKPTVERGKAYVMKLDKIIVVHPDDYIEISRQQERGIPKDSFNHNPIWTYS